MGSKANLIEWKRSAGCTGAMFIYFHLIFKMSFSPSLIYSLLQRRETKLCEQLRTSRHERSWLASYVIT